MKVRCLLIGVVVLVVASVLTTSSYAKLDPKTIAGMWLFDEGSGKIAADFSGNKNDGTLMNNAKWVAGKFGQALSFDGINAYVNIPNSDSLNPTSAITMAAWIQPVTVTNITYIEIMRQDSGDKRKLFSFQLNGTQLTLGLNTAGAYWETDFAIAAKDYTDEKWHHVVYTYDGAKAIFYKDGSVVNSQAHSGKIAVETAPLMIGTCTASGEWFTGLIDEVAMFNVALAEADVKALMNQGLKQALTAVDLSGKLATTWSSIKTKKSL